MNLTDVVAQCRALFLTIFWSQRYGSGSVTAEWLSVWVPLPPITNPPHIRIIPSTWEYLSIYFHEWEIWNPRGRPNQGGLLNEECLTPCEPCLLWWRNHGRCAFQLQSAIDWSLVSGSLHNVILPNGGRSAWYMVIHDIIPTNVKLHRIRLMDTRNCTQCGRQHTMLHRLNERGERQKIWSGPALG